MRCGELGQLLEHHEENRVFRKEKQRARDGGRRGGRNSPRCMRQHGDGSRQATSKLAVLWE